MSIPHDEHLIIGSPLIRSMSRVVEKPARRIRLTVRRPLAGVFGVLHSRMWCLVLLLLVDMGWKAKTKRQILEIACGCRERIPGSLQVV
jgi:hypothetical protein